MIRRGIGCLLALSLLLSLTGCVQITKESNPDLATLPPASVDYHVPDGDETIGSAQYRVLYVQDANELHLTPRMARTEPGELCEVAEALALRQLEAENQRRTEQNAESRPLTLYGDCPLEISGGICTVNLGSSALQMAPSDFYKFCVTLTTTLCDLDEISFVNVLVADQSVGLDITGSLAMGSLTAHPNENLPVLWEQMEAKRTPLGEELANTPLNAMATLYYPLQEGRGMACEGRILTFEGQTPQQLATGLLQELDETLIERGRPQVTPLLLHDPLVSELEDGGRLITLSFQANLEERLEGANLDLACTVAAMTYTLTTFIPGVAAVCVRMGEQPMTELRSMRFGSISILGGLVRRELFRDYLMGSTIVYLRRGDRLTPCEHTLFWHHADRCREQLISLMEGPTLEEQEMGILATLPAGLQEEDILGIAAEGETLLVNLSDNFREAIEQQGPEAEMMLCYSMVNTLCRNTGLRRMCFFFEGEQVEQIAGTLYWAGEFLYNPALDEQTV